MNSEGSIRDPTLYCLDWTVALELAGSTGQKVRHGSACPCPCLVPCDLRHGKRPDTVFSTVQQVVPRRCCCRFIQAATPAGELDRGRQQVEGFDGGEFASNY